MATLTARATTGSIFATVGNAANAVSSVFGATTKAVGALDIYVSDWVNEADLRSKANRLNVIERIAEEVGQEMSERTIQVDQFCDKSARHKQLFETNYQALKTAMTADNSAKA